MQVCDKLKYNEITAKFPKMIFEKFESQFSQFLCISTVTPLNMAVMLSYQHLSVIYVAAVLSIFQEMASCTFVSQLHSSCLKLC